MFKVVKTNTIQTRVTVNTVDEKGRSVTGNFGVEFERCTQDELDTMIDENWANSEVLDTKLRKVWDIGDADGNPLPEEEQLQYVLNDPPCVTACVKRYFELMGGDKGKGRTSRKRRATG